MASAKRSCPQVGSPYCLPSILLREGSLGTEFNHCQLTLTIQEMAVLKITVFRLKNTVGLWIDRNQDLLKRQIAS